MNEQKEINIRRRKYWLKNAILFWTLKLNFFRSKKIWVFGCWEGMKFDDNSRYLFEYMNEFHPEIRSVWISKNIEVVSKMQNRGYEAYMADSKMGKKIQLRAGAYFFTNGIDDIGDVTLIYGAKIIGLWHGTGMKNVYYQSPHMKKLTIHNLLKRIKDRIFNLCYQDYAIATSNKVAEMRAETYRLNIRKILITGQPRNDVFKRKLKASNVFYFLSNADEYRYILYMPTHRPYKSSAIEEFVLKISCNSSFVDYLKKENIRFILKLHYLTKIDKSLVKEPFFIVANDDVENTQELLAVSDYMITDYSGCCIDFAISKKPIFLYAPDFELYNQKVGIKKEWISIYNSYAYKEADSLIHELENVISGKFEDFKLFETINEIYESPDIRDTCYSENVFKAISQLL